MTQSRANVLAVAIKFREYRNILLHALFLGDEIGVVQTEVAQN